MRWLILTLLPAMAHAESLIATRLIPPGAVVTETDVALADADIPGALTTAAAAIGQSARIAIYPGRPLRPTDLGPPVLVKRNQTVTIRFTAGALSILAEGRALGSGGAGDELRVMNAASKSTLSGHILPDGSIEVKGTPCVGC